MVDNILRSFMKHFFLVAVFIIFGVFVVGNFQNSTTAAGNLPTQPNISIESHNTKNKQPVLIELFTSEDCPTCPPADRNLTFLDKEQPFAEADIIALSLHVDYRNALGSNDEFSSPIFSRRQDIYRQIFRNSSIYTPQMIVDGQTQFAGTDLAKAQKAIIESAKKEKGKIELSTVTDAKGNITLKAKISDLPKHEVSTVFLAVAEDNLASNRSENPAAKRVYTSVVRELKSLGFLTAEQKSFEAETFLQFQPNWKMENLKFVVFVQENGNRKVFGIGKLILPK